MGDRLDWDRDGRDWPHREASRFVPAGGLHWHVQQLGRDDAPAVLLLHGTGASTHSWRDLMEPLAQRCRVVAVDLPGHGFTEMPSERAALSLPGMAAGLTRLMQSLAVAPQLIVGHSAGAAIGARLCLDGAAQPQALVGINSALRPLGGLAGQVFSPVARLLALNPWVPKLFSWRATDPAVLQRLIEGTGSTLDAAGIAWYGRLVHNPGHAAAALGMMAQWDLTSLARELPNLRPPLWLFVGDRDRTVPPDQAWEVAQRVLGARVVRLPGLGHLAHEEKPAGVAALLLRVLDGQRIDNDIIDNEVVNLT